jgi:MSHA pilin protein MshD
MNTGQSLFSIGALLILSLTVLKMNNFILANDTVMQDSKLGILAVSLATSLIEEASKKSFDANTVENEVSACSLLTNYPLGRGTGEIEDSSITFNDFDDYDGYEYHYDYLPSAEYDLKCSVYYVSPSNPEVKVGYRTWHKKMDIIVSSESMSDTVKMSTVYSYWHFR